MLTRETDALDAITDEPLVRVRMDASGRPAGALGVARIAASPAAVWAVVRAIDRYPERVPMVHRAKVDGDQVKMQLRFKVALFSAKFGFTARMTTDDATWLEVAYVSGEPANIRLRFEVEPVDDGRASVVRVAVAFDILSLGWLASYFLRHHPEIQFGVFPGTAVVLLDSLRRAATTDPKPRL